MGWWRLGLLAASLAAASTVVGEANAMAATSRPPNVLVIVSDDQPTATFKRRYMPRTFKHLADPGTEFTNFVVTTPLCCPSRATLATGQYGHNNGVLSNSYGRLDRRRLVLPRWLQRAGYRTVHIGRFLNQYEADGRRDDVAPGWDVWRTALGPRRYYDYELTTNGGTRSFGTRPRDHLTRTLSRIAARMVRRKTPRKRPLYLQLDTLAPHFGPGSPDERCRRAAVPGPRDEDAYGGAKLPRGPAFDEASIGDKPPFLQGLEPFEPATVTEIERHWRCALGSIRTLDRGIGKLFRSLRKAKALRETVVIFTSDNGYLFGQHRIALDKLYPYEESVRVPLAIRLPKRRYGGQPSQTGSPAANIDLAPTILELAGAEPCKISGCRVMDGRSLLGEATGDAGLPADRAILLEIDVRLPRLSLACTYQGVRTGNDVYILHTRTRTGPDACESDNAVEHYDLAADRPQLTNLFPPAGQAVAERQAALSVRLAQLGDCSGIAGRDPTPLSGHYCE